MSYKSKPVPALLRAIAARLNEEISSRGGTPDRIVECADGGMSLWYGAVHIELQADDAYGTGDLLAASASVMVKL